MGGALFNLYGTATITNSTLAGNSAIGGNANNGGGGSGYGGAVFNLDGAVTLLNDTLANNTITAGTGMPNGFSYGGAIYNLSYGATPNGGAVTATLNLANCILSGSIGGSDLVTNQVSGTAVVNATGPNIVQATTTTPVGTPFTGGNPNLGPLQKNGGLSNTMALSAASPATGAGNVALAQAAGLTTDQRGPGFPRIVNNAIDLGAYQTQISEIAASTTPPGGAAEVRVFDAATQALKFDLHPFGAFAGEVRVALGDVNADGTPDLIVGAGPGGGPEVRVYNGNSTQLLLDFMAFNPAFSGGIYVASADINGDGYSDIIVGADAGGGPGVRVFSGKDGSLLRDFFAFNPAFAGGVRVAASDINRDRVPDIIVGAGLGGGPQVSVFSGVDGSLITSFFAFNPQFAGGVYVAAGQYGGAGEILVGAGSGGGPQVSAYSFNGSVVNLDYAFLAYAPAFAGGVRVGALSSTGQVVTGAGPVVGQFASGAAVDSFFAFNPTFTGGLYVAGTGV
jgi:hypothetical protein